MTKVRRLALIMLIVLGSIFGSKSFMAIADVSKQLESYRVNQTASQTPILLGLYAQGYIGNQSTIDSQLRQVDQWAGKRHSIVGFFFDIEDSNPAYNIPISLEQLRRNGYTAFINLKSTRSAAEIANTDIDASLHKVAKAYADWTNKGEGRMALIAPLPEMNILGEAYSLDPTNFKIAYKHIQKIFQQAGVSSKAVRWVFSPNGWSKNKQDEFENYNPGNDQVDVVAFSGYNWGYCGNSDWKHWSSPKEVFEPYIKRMQTMARNKPIFIAQTATTSSTSSGSQNSTKNQWLRDSYNYLANMNVQAIIYFNLDKECDWSLYSNNGESTGYRDALTNPAFGYVSPADLAKNL